MTKRQLNALLWKEPFEPFRINMVGGKCYDVTEPRRAVAMNTRMFLALPDGGWTFLPFQQMGGLETLPRSARRKR